MDKEAQEAMFILACDLLEQFKNTKKVKKTEIFELSSTEFTGSIMVKKRENSGLKLQKTRDKRSQNNNSQRGEKAHANIISQNLLVFNTKLLILTDASERFG